MNNEPKFKINKANVIDLTNGEDVTVFMTIKKTVGNTQSEKSVKRKVKSPFTKDSGN